MDARHALKISMKMGKMIADMYLADLTDEDLFVRPHPECNHIAWQLGHLIGAENQLTNAVAPGIAPPLPDGFLERYTKETARIDDPSKFDTKETYLRLFNEQREATLKALDQMTDEQLSAPGPESMREYAPTVADVFALQGSHSVMHSGQWVIVRRMRGRPIVI